jgi:anti-anti-sigma factor
MQRTIKIQDDLDAGTMATMRVLFEELAAGNTSVDLDLTRVTFIDSSGIGGLVFLYKRLSAAGNRLRLLNVTGQPLQLLNHLKLSQVLIGNEVAA